MTEGGDRLIRVTTLRRALRPADPMAAFLALAGRFGRDQVHLLESAAGPGREQGRAFLGFGLLCAVSVEDARVRVEGAPAVREAVTARIAPLLDHDADGLRLRRKRDLWPVLRAVRAAFDAPGSATEFRFGFLGFFGYDAGQYVEDLPRLTEPDHGLPDVQLSLYQGCAVHDPAGGRTELLLHESGAWPPLDPEEVAGLLERPAPAPPAPACADLPEASVQPGLSYEEFAARVGRSLEHIAVGDIYQVQLGHELAVDSPVDPVAVYLRLRERNASPYMYLAPLAGRTVVGASPESFVLVEDGRVLMRPIAGTVPRGRDDGAAERWLRSDPKELAEHTMLVDLCRNDLGRICRRDSLEVPSLFAVERYSHVLHLVSTVTARLEEGRDAFDVIAATFPAGTMTGTPKIRAMEIIEELEHTRRGLYGGALGLLDVGGYVDLALCIRTLVHHEGRYRTRASAGVVADSDPGREWTETLAKMSAPYWAVTGGELLRSDRAVPALRRG